jgi:hypothetical protein
VQQVKLRGRAFFVFLLRHGGFSDGVELVVVIVAFKRLELLAFGARTLCLIERTHTGALDNVFDAACETESTTWGQGECENR